MKNNVLLQVRLVINPFDGTEGETSSSLKTLNRNMFQSGHLEAIENSIDHVRELMYLSYISSNNHTISHHECQKSIDFQGLRNLYETLVLILKPFHIFLRWYRLDLAAKQSASLVKNLRRDRSRSRMKDVRVTKCETMASAILTSIYPVYEECLSANSDIIRSTEDFFSIRTDSPLSLMESRRFPEGTDLHVYSDDFDRLYPRKEILLAQDIETLDDSSQQS